MTLITRSLGLAAIFLAACASTPPAAVADCKTYCSSYEEGYQWAQNAGLTDERSCAGYPKEFVRGCQQKVVDLQQSFAPHPGF